MIKKTLVIGGLIASLIGNLYSQETTDKDQKKDDKLLGRLELQILDDGVSYSKKILPRNWTIYDKVDELGEEILDGNVDYIKGNFDYATHMAPGKHKDLESSLFNSGFTREMPESVRNPASCLMEYAVILDEMLPFRGKPRTVDARCASCTFEPKSKHKGSLTAEMNFVNDYGVRRKFIIQDLDGDGKSESCINYTLDEKGEITGSTRYNAKWVKDVPGFSMPQGLAYLSDQILRNIGNVHKSIVNPIDDEVAYEKSKF